MRIPGPEPWRWTSDNSSPVWGRRQANVWFGAQREQPAVSRRPQNLEDAGAGGACAFDRNGWQRRPVGMVVADKDLPPGAAAKKAWRRNRECAMTGSRRTAKARFSDEITYGK